MFSKPAYQFTSGSRIDQYKLEEKLGEGSFGEVYKVKEEKTGRTLALKVLKLWSVPEHAKENLIARFKLEYETGRIKSPNLVTTHSFGTVNDCPYFTMDYCPKGNLRDRINKGMTPQKAIKTAKQLLKGLKALHENGKIHRDLKPENVLFDQNDTARLSDFGITGHLNVQLTVVNESGKPENVLGSYVYMAPEQLSPVNRRQTLLPTIDIFTFGVICYELFSGGHLPFGPWEKQEDMAPYLERLQQGAYTSLEQYNDQLPAPWTNIVHQSLEKDIARRFQYIDQLLEQIEPLPKKTDTPETINLGIQIMQGEESGMRYNLYQHLKQKENSLLRIGRATAHSQNDIRLKETLSAYISRHHATLEYHKDLKSWIIRDGQWLPENCQWQMSRNGTFVNGMKANHPSGIKIKAGDIITLGNTTLKIIDFNRSKNN